MTTHDFLDGFGLIPARRHENGGGWVALTAQVADTAYVGPEAQVYGHARVLGHALIYDHARVLGHALIYDQALVSGSARVYGYARVRDHAQIWGNARVGGDARISGHALVSGSAQVFTVDERTATLLLLKYPSDQIKITRLVEGDLFQVYDLDGVIALNKELLVNDM